MKAIITQLNDVFYVRLEDCFNHPVGILVDGVRHDFSEGFQTSKKPQEIQAINSESILVYYVSGSGDRISVEEYNERQNHLMSFCDSNDGWEGLEREFDFRKFKAMWKPVHKPTEKLTDVPMVFLCFAGKDHPYIKPLRLIGNPKDFKEDQLLYSYRPNLYEMLQEIAKSRGFEQVEDGWRKNTVGKKWCIPDHSKKDLEFVHINGSYATSSSHPPRFRYVGYGTWPECFNAHNENVATITSWFTKALKNIEAIGAEFDKARMLRELEHIYNLVGEIDAKAKSRVSPLAVRGELRKIMEKL